MKYLYSLLIAASFTMLTNPNKQDNSSPYHVYTHKADLILLVPAIFCSIAIVCIASRLLLDPEMSGSAAQILLKSLVSIPLALGIYYVAHYIRHKKWPQINKININVK